MKIFALLALSASAAHARKVPTLPRNSPVFVRGGSLDPTITNTVVGLNAASGLFAFISPKANLEAYGVGADSTMTPDKTAYMRYVAALQIANAAVITVGDAKGAEAAVAAGFTATAVALLMAVPGFETLGNPKEPLALWVVGLGLLGKLAREGTIEAGPAMKIAVGILVLNGLQFFFAPQSAIDMYKTTAPVSAMGKSIFTVAGLNLLSLGAYQYFASTKNHMAGIAAFAGVGTAGMLKVGLLDAEKVGFDKKGPLAWAVIQAAIGYMAYKAIDA